MVRRHAAALLLTLVLAGVGAGDAVAAVPTLSSAPPTKLGGPPPGLSAPTHHHHASAPATPTTTSTQTTTTGSLPMTGADLPLELGVAGGLVVVGLSALLLGRSRRYRYRYRRF